MTHTLDRAAIGSGCFRYRILIRSVVFYVGLNKYVNNDHNIGEYHVTHGGVKV